MPKKQAKNLTEFVVPLNINGLQGRMLRLPARKKGQRETLLIYGHHASLERFFGLADALNDYGGVTMPDLPGFGGMDSFYKIGEKPTLDNLADYLAAFIKLRYRNRRLTIIGISFGFTIVTRMLQMHPDLAKKVDMLFSLVGFTHHNEFTFSRRRYVFYRLGAAIFSKRLPAVFYRNIVLHPSVIKKFYGRTHNAYHKYKNLNPRQYDEVNAMEVKLWRNNDLRTYMKTTTTLLTVDNCQKQVALPVWHLSVKDDNYFNQHIVEQHMRVIFSSYTDLPLRLKSHNLTILPNKKDVKKVLPPQFLSLLKSKT